MVRVMEMSHRFLIFRKSPWEFKTLCRRAWKLQHQKNREILWTIGCFKTFHRLDAYWNSSTWANIENHPFLPVNVHLISANFTRNPRHFKHTILSSLEMCLFEFSKIRKVNFRWLECYFMMVIVLVKLPVVIMLVHGDYSVGSWRL